MLYRTWIFTKTNIVTTYDQQWVRDNCRKIVLCQSSMNQV